MPPEFLLQMCLSALSIILTAIIGIIVKRMNDKSEERRADEKSREEYSALKDGIIAILRDRIIQADVHFSDRGHATISQKDNIQMMYDAYHRLGGNGIVTKSYRHIMELPVAHEEHA